MEKKYIQLMLMAVILVASNKIGKEQWCTQDKKTGKIECNYQTKEDCETYRWAEERCIRNTDFIKIQPKKHAKMQTYYTPSSTGTVKHK